MEPYLMFNCRSAIANILKAASKKIGQTVELFLLPGYQETAPAHLRHNVLYSLPELDEDDVSEVFPPRHHEEYKNSGLVPVFLDLRVIGAVQVTDAIHSLSEDQNYVVYVAATLISSCLLNYVSWNILGDESLKLSEKSEETDEVVKRIVKEFEAIRKKPKDDGWYKEGGKDTFMKKVAKYVDQGVAIPFLLLGFPLKSTNKKQKVLGELPDMAEYLCVKNIDTWCSALKSIYLPGVRFIIVSDGRIVAPFFNVPDETVLKYRQQVMKMVSSKHIVWLSLDDFLPMGKFSHEDKRVALDTMFSETLSDIHKMVVEKANFQSEYQGVQKMLAEEEQFNDVEYGERDLYIKNTAMDVMQRNKVYSDFAACMFPDHIHLSVCSHYNTDKVGINLFGKGDAATPWHSCAVLKKSGAWELMKREQAEKLGCEMRGWPAPAAPPHLQHFIEV